MSTTRPTQAATVASIRALIAGTQEHTPNGNFTLVNVAYTTVQLVQTLQEMVDLLNANVAARAAATEAVQAVKDGKAKYDATIAAYRTSLLASYGNAAQTLSDYGLAPKTARKPLDAKAMLAAADQNRATREARGTVGPKKKLTIKGVVGNTAQATAAPAVQATAAPAMQEIPAPHAQATAAQPATPPKVTP